MTPLIRSHSITGRLFAIGDIHGCSRELSLLLDWLVAKENLSKEDTVVFLGDYIDRGPQSRDVIETVLNWKKCDCIFLKGNHEDMMLDFIGLEGRLGRGWIQSGGEETLRSYGVEPSSHPDIILGAIPENHLRFLKSLESGVLIDPWLFVHAGIHPLRSLESQREKDLYWIRDEFVMNAHKLPFTVVFGHTPFEDVLSNLPYKIGLDTGLVYGHRLSCIEFTSGVLFQIENGGKSVLKKEFNLDRGIG